MSRLSDVPSISHGFSGVADGTMVLNGGFANRKKYLAVHGLQPNQIVHAGLCHGTNIAVVTTSEGGKIIPETDGLITTEANVGLAMTAADCLLISVYDSEQKAVGMFHAGRRGLASEIVTRFFDVWKNVCLCNMHDCYVSISPSICVDHYTISDSDAQAFMKWPDACQKRDDGIHLDLRSVAQQQLLSVGVSNDNITFDQRCTFEERTLFSYRRDHPITSQLQVGYLMRRE